MSMVRKCGQKCVKLDKVVIILMERQDVHIDG